MNKQLQELGSNTVTADHIHRYIYANASINGLLHLCQNSKLIQYTINVHAMELKPQPSERFQVLIVTISS